MVGSALEQRGDLVATGGPSPTSTSRRPGRVADSARNARAKAGTPFSREIRPTYINCVSPPMRRRDKREREAGVKRSTSTPREKRTMRSTGTPSSIKLSSVERDGEKTILDWR